MKAFENKFLNYGLAVLVGITGTLIDFKCNRWFSYAIIYTWVNPINPVFLFWMVSMFMTQILIAFLLNLNPKSYLKNILILIAFSVGLIAYNTIYMVHEGFSIGCPAVNTTKYIKDSSYEDGYRPINLIRWCPVTEPHYGILLLIAYYYILIPILIGAANPLILLIHLGRRFKP